MKGQEDTNKKTKDLKISLVIFAVITVLALLLMFVLKKLMPEFMMQQGKKYLEIGHYQKALQFFDMARESLPYSCEPIYYKAIVYSKMPQSYQNQKTLFEYSKLSDCDNVSEEVTKILNMMRNYYFKTSNETYIDNVLYKDKLIRWNNNDFITYYIDFDDSVPKEYIEVIRRAFFNWQIATNSDLKFREVDQQNNAKIYISFVDKLNHEEFIGHTTPYFNKNKLVQMKINFQKQNDKKKNYSNETMLSIAQHEIGHALGIWGHSANKEDVMYYEGDTVNSQLKVISPRDVNTITTIYKMVPDIIDRPLTEDQKPYLYFHNILTTYPNKNFENAINHAFAKLSTNKTLIDKWIELTKDFQQAQQYERANLILIKLLPYLQDNKETKYSVLYSIAENFYKLKDFENSKKYLNSALAIKKEISAQLLENILNIKTGKLELAERQLSVLAFENPDNIDIALKLAEVYNITKKKSKEKKVLKTLIKNNPNALKDVKVLKYRTNKKLS